MINQCTKFSTSRFTRYEAAQNAENGVVWGGQGALKVTGSAYDFLSDFNRNYVFTFYRFRDIAGYLSNVADFDPPHLHLAPP